MLVAQNTTVSLWEENLEQLSMDGEERNWEDELEELSRRLQEPININVATKRQLEEFPFLTAFQIEHLWRMCMCMDRCRLSMNYNW